MALIPIQRQSLAENAYETLLDAIICGDLAPGARLRIEDLAGELETSRVPVREAIKRLEADGLVETKSNAWTRVTPIRADQAGQSFPIIASLHGLATRLAVPALTKADDKLMLSLDAERAAALGAGDVLRAIEADDAFHAVLIDASHNELLRVTLARLMPQIRRLDILHFSRLTETSSSQDHARIIDACRRREPGLAAELVEENFLRLGEQMASLLEEGIPA